MFQSITRHLALILLLAGIIGCSWVRDDLTECPKGCQVQLKVDAGISAVGSLNAIHFAEEVHDASLFVFSSDGRFVGLFSEQGDALKQNDFILDLPLEPGHYNVVAWTGLADEKYISSQLTVGKSVMEDLEVLVDRDQENRQNQYLHPLWHGMIEDIEVKPHIYQLHTASMKKVNNNFVVVLHDFKGNSIKGDTFTFEIHSANGRMAYDQSLLQDDIVKYGAYFIETANLSAYESGQDSQGEDYTIARAEMNTLRLIKGSDTRLVIRERATGSLVLDIDLIKYILMTREYFEGRVGLKLTDQQYLDYEDKYSIIFTMMPTGSIINPYALVKLSINGWVLRPQDAIL
jgi:hypothetical protein